MQPTDHMETICGSRVQHGPLNRRIYVMHLNMDAVAQLLPALDRLADDKGYGKITAKIPAHCWTAFRSAGYTREALVPGFFNGRTDGLFVARFLSTRRMKSETGPAVPVSETSGTAGPDVPAVAAGDPLVGLCSPSDVEALGRIYRDTFASYPFPIHNPDFLRQTMAGNVFYYGIRVKDRFAAAAAVETDPANRSCEMTDFATRPEYRRRGFAGRLLGRMHRGARKRGLGTAYTIARADSPGMNRVFRKRGYRFAGRLINNTHIAGGIRDMNVWYRRL